MTKLIFLAIVVLSPLSVHPQTSRSGDLEKYVGYYDVGVKPGHPSFRARMYLRGPELYIIFDGDKDHRLIMQDHGQLRYEFDTLSRYTMTFAFENNRVKTFKVARPRDKWSTDLYGSRNSSLDQFAVDTEALLDHVLSTTHFNFYSPAADSATTKKFSALLEKNYDDLLRSFGLTSIDKISIRVYPDLATYHNSVLTPNAPAWQMGRAWTKKEIRMLSPGVAQNISKEEINLNEIVLHEFVHCLHLHLVKTATRVPGWLWEGVAMYKGCCEWGDPKTLEYLIKKKYPTLKEITMDNTHQKKYDLGYYLIEFVDETYGWEKVQALIRNNGDIKNVLNISVRDFEKKFYDFMERNYLTR
jgi:hypothetical protein